MRTLIRIGEAAFEAEVFDTPSGRALMEVLPLETAFQVLDGELCFSAPMHPQSLESAGGARASVGEIVYWPEGHALSILLESAPGSGEREAGEFRPVNRVGRLAGDPSALLAVAAFPTVRIEPG